MKILHTSDWHLGKKLEGQSRILEQKLFINNLADIIQKHNVDLLLIAGDIYDTYNPSADAEKLFFDSLKQLSFNGKVGIILIAGNHDNPSRLEAISYLSKDYGSIIFDIPFKIISPGQYGVLNIYNSVPGGIYIDINGESIYLYALPYPNDSNLNENFNETSYDLKIKQLLEEGISHNKDDIPTIIMTHLYVAGSMGEDIKNLELGGAKAISINSLPNVDYIALGHVHKPMIFKKKNAYYCGSPIEYRVTENRFNKQINIIDTKKSPFDIQTISLENYKPIKEYTVTGGEEAIQLAENTMNIDEWIYLNIKINTPLTNSQIKNIKKNKNILEIIPIIDINTVISIDTKEENKNLKESFIEFFKEESEGLEPTDTIINLFLDLVGED